MIYGLSVLPDTCCFFPLFYLRNEKFLNLEPFHCSKYMDFGFLLYVSFDVRERVSKDLTHIHYIKKISSHNSLLIPLRDRNPPKERLLPLSCIYLLLTYFTIHFTYFYVCVCVLTLLYGNQTLTVIIFPENLVHKRLDLEFPFHTQTI